MTHRHARIAVLGAGLMGCSVAIYLARTGFAVTLVDRASSAMERASRWNEGKIHLGFLYSADPSMRTAKSIIPGGLAFKALTEELIGTSLSPAVSQDDDIYLIHPQSVTSADAAHRYFQRVQQLIGNLGAHGPYLAPMSVLERLSTQKLEALCQWPIRAGFRVPERSVRTGWVADRIVDALSAESRIQLLLRTSVSSVEPIDGSWQGPWKLRAEPAVDEQFDIVVNALWEGRISVDRATGLHPEPGWTHRFRQSLFVETCQEVPFPSVTLATGPFGDVKRYSARSFYLSWYPVGLLAQGSGIIPPSPTAPDKSAFVADVRRGLCEFLPGVAEIFSHAGEVTIGGGYVFARGSGALSDRNSSLHRRDEFGITRMGTYYSIDTGKYSVAPWLAWRVVNEIR